MLQTLVPWDLRLYIGQTNNLLISTSVSDRRPVVTKDLKIYQALAIKSLISKEQKRLSYNQSQQSELK